MTQLLSAVDVHRSREWLARSEASLIAERSAAARRATAATAKAAGRKDWAPLPGSATSNPVTGGVVHAQAGGARSGGLWHVPALPTVEDTTRGVWVARVKAHQAQRTELAQAALQDAVAAATATLRAECAAAEREAHARVADAQVRSPG
jgi:hypothetical protein